MRMYFVEAKEDKGKELKKAGQWRLLDESLRTDSQGDVTIEIRFVGITIREDLAFNVKITGHSVKLGQYPLDKQSILSNDKGKEVQPSKWEISYLSMDGIYGTVYFPAKDASGSPLLAQNVNTVTLTLKELGGIAERVFQWNLEGKGAKGKIFCFDDDFGMHVSFSNFWRAVKDALKPAQKESK